MPLTAPPMTSPSVLPVTPGFLEPLRILRLSLNFSQRIDRAPPGRSHTAPRCRGTEPGARRCGGGGGRNSGRRSGSAPGRCGRARCRSSGTWSTGLGMLRRSVFSALWISAAVSSQLHGFSESGVRGARLRQARLEAGWYVVEGGADLAQETGGGVAPLPARTDLDQADEPAADDHRIGHAATSRGGRVAMPKPTPTGTPTCARGCAAAWPALRRCRACPHR